LARWPIESAGNRDKAYALAWPRAHSGSHLGGLAADSSVGYTKFDRKLRWCDFFLGRNSQYQRGAPVSLG
jgi:hypothetical protein